MTSSTRYTAKALAHFFLLLIIAPAAAVRDIWGRAVWRACGVNIARNVIVRPHASSAIKIGPGATIGWGTLLIATSEMSTLPAQMSRLVIGDGTAINEYCNLRASGGEIVIGRQCLIAQMVTIVASNHSVAPGRPMMEQAWSTEPRSVVIGDDVWIGAGAILLPGARVGDGAIIAAGAVVRGVVPAGELWAGVPARFIRRRDSGATRQ